MLSQSPRASAAATVTSVSVADALSVFDPRNPKGIYLHAPSLAPIRTKICTERELVLIMKNLQSFAVLFIFLEVRCISVEQHSKI